MTTKPHKLNSHIFDILFLALLASVPRLLLLFSSQAGIESDEAIVGLMAKHISEGKGIPIFYYGQPYMGSLEAIFASLSFLLFDISNYSLKLVPFLFSLSHVALVYLLGLRLSSRLTGFISGLYVALGPSPLIIWSLKARGGFIETIVLGSLSLLLSARILSERRTLIRNFAFLGLVLGLGWWTNNQIIFFIAPIGISLIYFFLKERTYSIIEIGRIFLVGMASFILGGLPFWIYNLKEKPKWQSFDLLFGQTAGGSSLEYFGNYWTTALPIILGARKFWSDLATYEYSTGVIYSLFAVCLIASLRDKSSTQGKASRYPIYLFLISTPLIFSLSSFGWLSKAPRYLLPLYSVLPLLLGLSVNYTYKSRRLYTHISVVALIIAHNLCSNYLDGKIADEGQPMVYRGERVSNSHQELYSWLLDRNCSHIHTNYWIGYRASFETKEKITFTRFGTPRSLRIKEYESVEKSGNGSCGLTYVLVPSEAQEFKKWLSITGQRFEETTLDNYTIIHNISYKQEKGERISTGFKARVFIPPDNSMITDLTKSTELLFDNSKDTRWGSGQSQKAGMALEIDFDKPVSLRSLNVDLGRFKHDAPSSLVISAYTSPTERVFLFDMRGTRMQSDIRDREFGDVQEVWDIRFPDVRTKRLRLELMEESPVFDWSIAELEFYGSPALQDTKN